MKKIMAVIVALMFVSTMAFTGMAFAGGPKEKGKAPMSEKAKDGKKVSADAKAKDKGKSAETKMGKMDKKGEKDEDKKEEKKSK